MRIIFLLLTTICLAQEVSDCGRLYHAQVKEIVVPHTVDELQKVVRKANSEGIKVSFAGQRMSQGGHTFLEGGISIEMRHLNHILAIDVEQKTIEVEGGATWEEIQNAVNEVGLAIKVMQSSNIFTVGGSLSTNVHGRDPNYGPIIETVRSIKVMRPDGMIAKLTPENPLFSFVIGGYGAFGPIVSVTLELTDNVTYRKSAEILELDQYLGYFREHVLGRKKVGLHFARFSLSSRHFLERLIAVSYKSDSSLRCDSTLIEEQNVGWNQKLLSFLRTGQFFKTCRWPMEIRKEKRKEILTRNQAMRPPVKCLEFNSKTSSDLLQEYFIPLDQFVAFSKALKKAVKDEKINLLNVTVRYVPKDTRAKMAYAKSDVFAFVLYFNHRFDKGASLERFTNALIDDADRLGGTFYLPYQLFAERQKVLRGYPELEKMREQKKVQDPHSLFSSTFIKRYVISS